MPFSKKAKRELLYVYALNAIKALDFLMTSAKNCKRAQFLTI